MQSFLQEIRLYHSKSCLDIATFENCGGSLITGFACLGTTLKLVDLALHQTRETLRASFTPIHYLSLQHHAISTVWQLIWCYLPCKDFVSETSEKFVMVLPVYNEDRM